MKIIPMLRRVLQKDGYLKEDINEALKEFEDRTKIVPRQGRVISQ